ncbi:hypothetical protein HYY72_04940 [Candidatus Woesearchaeota archaeon]|nr:hypothetical protein [Candidatus Woesearchaeota archaeon]
MQIKELTPKQGNVDIDLEIAELGIIREFSKFGKAGRVLTAVATDETGKIMLTLWNEQIELVKAGDRIRIRNGYVNEWQGEKQLTTGRTGTLEVIKQDEKKSSDKKKKAKHN